MPIKLPILFIAIMIWLSSLTGCDLFSEKEYDEVWTDSDGNVYYIINDNHIDFSKNNVLEIVVSESERFILYDYDYDAPDPGHKSERGVGEWIIDGTSIPIHFQNDNYGYNSYLHGDILIAYDDYNGEDKRPTPSNSIFIAKIKNDPTHPELRWCIGGSYVYSPKFSDQITTVKYRTYTRTEGVKESPLNPVYVPLAQSPFYSVPDDMKALYKFELAEDFFEFDATTGRGIWNRNGTSYPVVLQIDKEAFTFSVIRKTTEDTNGQLILSGEGICLNESNATYNIKSFSNDIDNSIPTLTVHKEWTYPSEEWKSFISVIDNDTTSYVCEKGGFSCNATSMEGVWQTNGGDVAIRIEFDTFKHQMNIYDISTNECILNATGYMQDETTAIFDKYTGNMFYANILGELVVKKQ